MRFPVFRLLCLFALLLTVSARAAEPVFKKGDVVALVGGEDMVVASEEGSLEALLDIVLPDYHLRFRNLAWEGDTVFEQRRDLNFPSWEEQLDKVGATIVIAQFGEMESLAGTDKVPEFIAAYEKLADRFSAGGKRRIVIVTPSGFDVSYTSLNPSTARFYNAEPKVMRAHEETLRAYNDALKKFATEKGYTLVPTFVGAVDARFHRDGIHLDKTGQSGAASSAVEFLINDHTEPMIPQIAKAIQKKGPEAYHDGLEQLRKLVVAKNQLWFNYWRPQNWAFLAGDRTNQPSSRDWRDPSIRWFPPEREEFIPLVEAKEKEIDALALKLSQP